MTHPSLKQIISESFLFSLAESDVLKVVCDGAISVWNKQDYFCLFNSIYYSIDMWTMDISMPDYKLLVLLAPQEAALSIA